jgi:transposase
MTENGINSLISAQVSSAAGAAPQGARRATERAAPAGRAPDPEVVATAKRRRFPASEKRRILAEADLCKKPGELGALMRRERIYSSMLSSWRKQRDLAAEGALAPQRRGRKPDPARPERERIAQLEREKARLEGELAQARTINDVQKKLCTLLGLPTADSTDEK